MKELSSSAVPCVTRGANTGTALAPVADAANVLPIGIGKEDIRSTVPGLGSAFESTSYSGKRGKIGVISDCYQ